jgi:beta-mannosidase
MEKESKMNEQLLKLSDWHFSGAEQEEWLPAQVPGTVHTDLLRNGKIAEPFVGTNEHRLQWIDKAGWQYRNSFDLTQDMLTQSRVELVFDGLDTYAEVYVNGHHVLSADNMFRSWTADIKSYAKERGNEVLVQFRSPVEEDLPKLEQLGYGLPASNDQSELGGLGERRVSVFARKAPYHYGWDWGPRFVTSGIWREVRVRAWTGSRVADLYVEQKSVTAALANLRANVEVESDADWEGVLVISTGDKRWERNVSVKRGLSTVSLDLEIANPELWWSRGLGEPHLYTFEAELLREGALACKSSVRTGLRSVRLVTDKDERGSAFYIELNGVPVFAKGANHIPNDSFLPEVSYERYRHEVASAAEANMNMLRVWGGGIYEEAAFYELCDEYGIMVWQDFMFACSMYPGDEAFLASVRKEAEENVRRLRNYPSVVLWCGNNEIDTAWSHYNETGGWGWKQDYSNEQREQIWADYEQVFHRILPEVIEKHAGFIPYWPSSPMTALTGDETQHAFSTSTSGDIHYWGVWHSVEPFEAYNSNIGRFMSEYGFQSFPELKTVLTYAEESDLRIDSEVMLAHQKNGRGNQLIKEYMDMYLQQPKDFPSFLYLSQVLQAEAMKTAIEAHRRQKPFCMGSLYWQMNDCWPVASWAGIDYYGRWKALHYYAKRSFADVMLSVDGTQPDRVDCYAVNDTQAEINAELMVELMSFDGELKYSAVQEVAIEAGGGGIVWSALHADLIGADADRSELVLVLRLRQGTKELYRTEHYFVEWKQLKLGTPTISVREVPGSGGTQFELSTDKLALKVRLTTETEGIFSDNYFDLLPNAPQTVSFYGRSDGAAPFLPAAPIGLKAASMAEFVQPE